MYPEKTFTPDGFQLWGDPLRKATPAFGNVPRKNIPARQLSAFGRYSAKSLSSVQKCTPKKRSRQAAFGFWSIPCEKSRQPSEMFLEKTFLPEGLRLWVNPFRKISPATCCDTPKKYSSRQPSALGRYPTKSPTSLRNCALKRRSGQAASSFGEILCEKPLQPLEMYPEKMFPPDSFRLLVDTLQKASPAFRNVPRKNVHVRRLSTLGRYSAKSLSSLRRCTPAIRLGLSALGCNKDKRNGTQGLQVRCKFPKDASYSPKRAEKKRTVLQIAFSYVKKRFGDLEGPQDTPPRKYVSASNPRRTEEKYAVL